MQFAQSLLSIVLVAMLSACATNDPVQTTSGIPAQHTQTKTATRYVSPCLQISLQNNNSGIKTGYGSGRTVAEAKQRALYDIAKQIEVAIDGTETATTNKQDDQVTTGFSQNVKARASQILTSVETACSDTNDPTGSYHFALRYDQRPLVDIYAQALSEQFWQQRPGRIEWQGPKLITQSTFIKQLEQRLVQTGNPQSIRLTVQLFRKNAQWKLIINDIVRTLQTEHYTQLINWQSLHAGSLQVQLQNEYGQALAPHLRDGDDFYFKITNRQTGYLTVFDIYEDGRVTKLRENITIKSKLKLPEHKGAFSAGLLIPGQSTRDQYVFLLTDQPINATAFHQLQLEKSSTAETSNYSLNIFLSWLDKQPIVAADTLLVETVPR